MKLALLPLHGGLFSAFVFFFFFCCFSLLGAFPVGRSGFLPRESFAGARGRPHADVGCGHLQTRMSANGNDDGSMATFREGAWPTAFTAAIAASTGPSSW